MGAWGHGHGHGQHGHGHGHGHGGMGMGMGIILGVFWEYWEYWGIIGLIDFEWFGVGKIFKVWKPPFWQICIGKMANPCVVVV